MFVLINIDMFEVFKNSVFIEFGKRFQVTAALWFNTVHFFRTLPFNVHCLDASILLANPQKPYKIR